MQILIVGSGFEGIYTAYLLKKVYKLDVTLIDASSRFGAVMAGMRKGEFALDFGCQVFDNFDVELTEHIKALSQGNWVGKNISYGSKFAGAISHKCSSPDLSHLPDDIREKMLAELLVAAETPLETSGNLESFFHRKWGGTVASYMERVPQKILNMASADVDAACTSILGSKRVKLVENARAKDLKAASFEVDDRLGMSRVEDQIHYPDAFAALPFTNIQPSKDSFVGFCESAHRVLQEIGVDIQMQTSVQKLEKNDDILNVTIASKDGETNIIKANHVFWTGTVRFLDTLLYNEDSLESHISPIGMNLNYIYAQNDQINDLGYFQNYDPEESFYRWSSMGLYTDQVDSQGRSFVCIETPSTTKQDDPASYAAQQWEEIKSLNLVQGNMQGEADYLYAPNVLNRFLPGFTEAAEKLCSKLDEDYPNILYTRPNMFGRVPAAMEAMEKLKSIL